MRQIVSAGLILILAACTSTPVNESEPRHYDWSASPDFTGLRTAWGWSDSFRDNCEVGRPLSDIVGKMNQDQWSDAAAIGQNWLAQCPVDIRVHYFTAISLAELGETEKAEHHFRWTEGLMDSVVTSGNGETPETAYKTISVPEGYDALYLFGLEVKNQSLITDPVMLDLIVAVNENGQEFAIYFNPAAHFARLYELFNQ